MHEVIENMRIEALDRHLGALLGLVEGAMFSMFLTFFLVTLSHSARESIINSESGYVAAVAIDRLDPVIPGDLHALLEPYLRRMDPRGIEREHRDEESHDVRETIAMIRLSTTTDRTMPIRIPRPDGADRDHRTSIDHRGRTRPPGRDGLYADRRDDGMRRESRSSGDRRRDRGVLRRADDAPTATRHSPRDLGPPGDDESHGSRHCAATRVRRLTRDRRQQRDPSRLLSSKRRPAAPPRTPRTDERPVCAGLIRRDDDGPGRRQSRLALVAALIDEVPPDRDRGLAARQPDRGRELARRLSSGSVPDLIRKTTSRSRSRTDGDGARRERVSLERQIVRALGASGGRSADGRGGHRGPVQRHPGRRRPQRPEGLADRAPRQKSDPRDVDRTTLCAASDAS